MMYGDDDVSLTSCFPPTVLVLLEGHGVFQQSEGTRSYIENNAVINLACI